MANSIHEFFGNKVFTGHLHSWKGTFYFHGSSYFDIELRFTLATEPLISQARQSSKRPRSQGRFNDSGKNVTKSGARRKENLGSM